MSETGAVGRSQARNKEKVTARKKAGRPPAKAGDSRESRADFKERENRNYWTLFPEAFHQDLEDDSDWRRTRRGPSQGTGRRR
ncbi:hypothetical protein [Sinomonas notoginsengisoli]